MSISAAQVKELRELSGAGMMDCKAALEATKGDLDAAVDWLRKKGIAKADKKANRVAAEGLIGVASSGNKAILIEINSETDFVARNQIFQDLVKTIAQAGLNTDGSFEAISKMTYPGDTKIVTEVIKDTAGKIGENLNFRRSEELTVDSGIVATYMHNSVADGLGKLGVLVAIETTGDQAAASAFGRQVAMHIAATNPLALVEEDVSADAVEREKAIFADQARQSGKPENIIEKMVEGRMRKFFEEVVLLSQSFVMNPDLSVREALKDAEKMIGAPAKIVGFKRFALGDGIEKEESDFSAEVAATARG